MKKVILAVDDQPEVLTMLESILGHDYDVIAARTTARAFAVLARENIDLILLDVMMPGMDGIEVYDYLKQQAYFDDVPVLFVTSDADVDTVNKALKLGAKGYIRKPIQEDALLEKVKNVLENRPFASEHSGNII
jgi:CheY-like chemotaxis protein